MFRLVKLLLSLVLLAALAYFAVAVPLGTRTLWEHLKAIAGTRESQDLVDGVKQKAREVIRHDGGIGGAVDKLTPKERELLRKLIREKLKQEGGK